MSWLLALLFSSLSLLSPRLSSSSVLPSNRFHSSAHDLTPQAATIAHSTFDILSFTSQGCAPNIVHHHVTPPTDTLNHHLHGIVTFDNISVQGVSCDVASDDSRMELLTYDYFLSEQYGEDLLNLTFALSRNITTVGVDFARRTCGDYVDSFVTAYYFTDAIFDIWHHLVQANLGLDPYVSESNLIGNNTWMITTRQIRGEPSPVCVYLAPSSSQEGVSTTSPTPEPPTTEDPGDVDPGDGGDDGGTDGSDTAGDDAQPPPAFVPPEGGSTFEQADEEGRAEAAPDDDSGSCFPAHATVRLLDGSKLRMSELHIGHHVQVGSDAFSPVILFTHRQLNTYHTFVRLRTASARELMVTPSHYVYAAHGRAVAARHLKVGDSLMSQNGSVERIMKVERTMSRGLFNPQTKQGNIVVDGFLVSTYTEAIEPRQAHAMLMPLRAVFNYVGWSWRGLEDGTPATLSAFL